MRRSNVLGEAKTYQLFAGFSARPSPEHIFVDCIGNIAPSSHWLLFHNPVHSTNISSQILPDLRFNLHQARYFIVPFFSSSLVLFSEPRPLAPSPWQCRYGTHLALKRRARQNNTILYKTKTSCEGLLSEQSLKAIQNSSEILPEEQSDPIGSSRIATSNLPQN